MPVGFSTLNPVPLEELRSEARTRSVLNDGESDFTGSSRRRIVHKPEVIPARRSELRDAMQILASFMDGVVPLSALLGLATTATIALIFNLTGVKAFAGEIPQPIIGILAQQIPGKAVVAPQSKFVQNNTRLILDSDYVDLLLEASDAKGLYAVLKDTMGRLILLDAKGGLRDRIWNKLTNLKSGLSVEDKNVAKNWMSALVIVGNQAEIAAWSAKPGVAALLTSNSALKDIRGKIVLELLNAVSAEDYQVLVAITRNLRQAAALGDIATAQSYLSQHIQGLQRRPNGGWSVVLAVQTLIRSGELVSVSA
jgi:hypothetical protein